jgi:hypothetical protein
MKNFLANQKNQIIVIAVIYFVFRITNAILVKPYFDEYDTPPYFELKLFPSFRGHGITIFYSLIKNEFAITIFQAAVGSLAWIFLWIIILRLIRSFILQYIFTFLFFILAISSVIVEHDSALLSESLAISSTVFVFAAAINLYLSKKIYAQNSILIFGIGIIWFLSTKSSNSLILPIIGLIYLITLFRICGLKLFIVMGTTFVIISSFILANSLSSDITKTLNSSGTINNRLLYVNEWKSQLFASGYPIKSIEIWKDFSDNNLGLPPDQAVVNMSEFKDWWIGGGDSFLIKFMIRNPDYGLIAPLAFPLFSQDVTYRATLLSGWSQGTDQTLEYPGFKNSLLIRTFYWPDETEKAYLALSISLFILGISLLVLIRFRKSKEFNLIILTLFLTVFWSYLNWWFGSKPSDMARHNISAAIMFKIVPLFTLILSFDELLKRCKKL